MSAPQAKFLWVSFIFEPGVASTIPFPALRGTFATLTHFFFGGGPRQWNSMMSVMSGKDQE